MANTVSVPTYIGNGPLGPTTAITSATAGSASASATITAAAPFKQIQNGNQVLLSGSSGGTGTWNAVWTVTIVNPTTLALASSSSLTGVPTLTNAVVQVIENAAVAQTSGQGIGGELAYIGLATITGDNSASTVDINFIDGTLTIPFTPTAVTAFRTGGTTTATIGVAECTSPTNQKFTLNTTANITSATLSVIFFVYR